MTDDHHGAAASGELTEFGAEQWTIERGGLRVEARVRPGRVLVVRKPPRPEDDAGSAALLAIAQAVATEVRREPAQILTWQSPRHRSWNEALFAAGFVEIRRKLFVKKDLTGPLPEPGSFGWRTLAEAGETEFNHLMLSASHGDPFEDADDRDPEREWRELVEHAGEAFDPTLWRIALLDGRPVGVVLPTVWKGDETDGTLSYVGVLPHARGQGLGRGLHAAGLHLLAEAGAREYFGSTDARNAAMARILERNGCAVTGTQLFLAVRPSPTAASA